MTGARRIAWIGFAAALSLNAVPSWATHEADHRFRVHGSVRDDQGRPLKDAKVIVVDPRLSESGVTAFTDGSGNYEAVLHLHNTDLGDEIIVTTAGQRKTVRAEFDPADRTSVRGARVDFGAAASGTSGSGGAGGTVLTGAAAAAAAIAAGVWLRRKRRRASASPKKGFKNKK